MFSYLKRVYERVHHRGRVNWDMTLAREERGGKMIKLSIGVLAFIGFALVFAGNVNFKRVSGPSGLTTLLEVTDSKAYAGRRGGRRGGRGHQRRHVRRLTPMRVGRFVSIMSLPYGCIWRPPFHYCGGIYYEPVVTVGVTTYIVVYP